MVLLVVLSRCIREHRDTVYQGKNICPVYNFIMIIMRKLVLSNENSFNKYVVVSADKASNNLILVCKYYYISCLQKQLGLLTDQGKSSYNYLIFRRTKY